MSKEMGAGERFDIFLDSIWWEIILADLAYF